jgi:hypothetical protein
MSFALAASLRGARELPQRGRAADAERSVPIVLPRCRQSWTLRRSRLGAGSKLPFSGAAAKAATGGLAAQR